MIDLNIQNRFVSFSLAEIFRQYSFGDAAFVLETHLFKLEFVNYFFFFYSSFLPFIALYNRKMRFDKRNSFLGLVC